MMLNIYLRIVECYSWIIKWRNRIFFLMARQRHWRLIKKVECKSYFLGRSDSKTAKLILYRSKRKWPNLVVQSYFNFEKELHIPLILFLFQSHQNLCSSLKLTIENEFFTKHHSKICTWFKDLFSSTHIISSLWQFFSPSHLQNVRRLKSEGGIKINNW